MPMVRSRSRSGTPRNVRTGGCPAGSSDMQVVGQHVVREIWAALDDDHPKDGATDRYPAQALPELGLVRQEPFDGRDIQKARILDQSHESELRRRQFEAVVERPVHDQVQFA